MPGVYDHEDRVMDPLPVPTTAAPDKDEGLSSMQIQFIIVGVLFGLVVVLGLVNVYIHLISNKRRRGFRDLVPSGGAQRSTGGGGDGPKRTKAMLLF